MSTTIAFMGAGIATSYTLLPLLDQLIAQPKDATIYVIDKSDDFFCGLAYGKRSGKSVLLINSLRSFMPDTHRTDFKIWLNTNKATLTAQFATDGGGLASEWLSVNKESIDHGLWDDLYIPRFFFGNYIKEEVSKRIAKIATLSNISLVQISKEIITVHKNQFGYTINFEDSTELSCDVAVLSVGSMPNKKLLAIAAEQDTSENKIYISNLYQPDLNTNIKAIKAVIQDRKLQKTPTNILVLGANASGLEAIYRTYDDVAIANDCHYTCLSTHGVMPDGTVDFEKLKGFKTKYLDALVTKEHLTASEIAKAVNDDLDVADTLQIGAASTVGIISAGFGKLLSKLSEKELITFSWDYGNQIGRRQRCAGEHYLSVVDLLSKNKRFEQIKGRFEKLIPKKNFYELSYSKEAALNTSTKEFHVVINCLGSINLQSPYIPQLVKTIFDKKIAKANGSKIGITVNDNMEASTDFHVAGPLLAGNLIQDKVLWHLEHYGRIIWSSAILADILYKKI